MKEKTITVTSGFVVLGLLVLLVGLFIYQIFSGITSWYPWLTITNGVVIIFIAIGFMIIYPNQSRVMTLFGKYVGTVKDNGFKWANPFYYRQNISLRARNFDSERVKVNDKRGNPILISVILVWKVRETYKAAFEVDNFESFVKVQSDAAVRKLAGMYSYDNFDDEQEEVTLRSNVGTINDALENELTERLEIAGIEVIEARIGYLAYAPEIAGAMLKRQQAEAVVAARLKIVEGAVGMVENALNDLSKNNMISLDEDRRASMVSNLMVVLCSDKEATPVINTGTLLP